MFGLFRMPRFLRRFIRRRMAAVPQDRAMSIKQKLSVAYAVVAWHFFGFIGYMVYSGRFQKLDEEDTEHLSQGRQFVKMLKFENVTLHRIEGMTYVSSCDLNEENLLAPKTDAASKESVEQNSELNDSQ